MIGIPVSSWLLCTAAVFASGVLRGFGGFGFALAATPLLGSVLAPSQAVPLVLLLQVGASLIGWRDTVSACDRPSVTVIGCAAVIAAPVGVVLLSICTAAWARLAIAALTLLSILALTSGIRFADRPRFAATVPFGLAAGLCGGLCAMSGPPIIFFYLAGPFANRTARASMVALFLLIGLASLAAALVAGLVTQSVLLIALATVPAMAAGTVAGSRLFERYHDTVYRRGAVWMLVASAVVAIVRTAGPLVAGGAW